MAVYPVGVGQTYATIQAAHDQVVIDNDVTPFTEEQEIRIYDGTYTEYVTIDHTLEPQPRYRLKFMAAVGNSPVWSCQGLAGVMHTAGTLAFVNFDGLTFAGTSSGNTPISVHYNSQNWEFRNCTFTLTPTGVAVVQYTYQNFYFIDCEMDGSGGGGATYFILTYGGNRAQFIRCDIHDYAMISPVGATGVFMKSCTVHDVVDVLWGTSYGHVMLLNNTFYNITGSVLNEQVGRSHLVMLNNVFDTVTAVIAELADPDDAFSASHIIIDGNCYHNVTKWYDSVAESDVTTFAAWQALGYDVDGMEADPLLTNPDAGDFSLQSGSLCKNAGVGSGVLYDVDGNPFDKHHPDIGAVSMGPAPSPSLRYGAELVRVLA